MNNTAYPSLRQLLGGYFHQDFYIVHGTEAQAITNYVRTNWRDDVEQAIEEIDRYLREHPIDLLAAFETEFKPCIIIGSNDDEARAWLIRTRDQLQSELVHAPLR